MRECWDELRRLVVAITHVKGDKEFKGTLPIPVTPYHLVQLLV